MASAWELAVPAMATLAGIGVGQIGQWSSTGRQWRRERQNKYIDERRQAYVKFTTWLDTVIRLESRVAALRKDVDLQMEIADTRTKQRAHLQQKIDELTSSAQKLVRTVDSDSSIAADKDKRLALLARAEELKTTARRTIEEGETFNSERKHHLEMAAQLESRLDPINVDLTAATAETFEWALTLEMIAPSPVQESLSDLLDAVIAHDQKRLPVLRSAFMQAVRKDLVP